MELSPLLTVGDLRQAIDAFKDDAPLFPQVAATDGSAMCMQLTAGLAISSDPPKLCITLRHPHLKALPPLSYLMEPEPSPDIDRIVATIKSVIGQMETLTKIVDILTGTIAAPKHSTTDVLKPLILTTARILLSHMRAIQEVPSVQPDIDLYDEMRDLSEALEPFEPIEF